MSWIADTMYGTNFPLSSDIFEPIHSVPSVMFVSLTLVFNNVTYGALSCSKHSLFVSTVA